MARHEAPTMIDLTADSDTSEDDELEVWDNVQVGTNYQDQWLAQKQHEEYLAGLRLAEKLQKQEAENHAKSLTKEGVRQTLSVCQLQALLFVEDQARLLHEAALPTLRERVKRAGFEESALDKTLEYIRQDAPIIIHLKEDTLRLLTSDTHYRNLFETNTSGGNNDKKARGNWEERLFAASYNLVDPTLRPKYGCLNLMGDIQGVKPARAYGNFYLTLKGHVRHRTTMSDRDTGNYDKELATCEYYGHVLQRFSEEDLKTILSATSSTSTRNGGTASDERTYKECQIHGFVKLSADIEALSVPGKECAANKNLKDMVAKFQTQTGCNVMWQGDLLGA